MKPSKLLCFKTSDAPPEVLPRAPPRPRRIARISLLILSMKSAVRSLTPQHPNFRRWGGSQSPMLSAMVSKEALSTGYEELSRREVIEIWKKADIAEKTGALEPDHKFKSTLGEARSWRSWLATPLRSDGRRKMKEGSAEKTQKTATKKRSSWLPDPNRRWPQGW